MFVSNLTDGIVSNAIFGYFPKVIANLYIFFPLMTMGLISRETSSFNIEVNSVVDNVHFISRIARATSGCECGFGRPAC